MSSKPARCKLFTLAQLCNLIPSHLVSKLATKHGKQVPMTFITNNLEWSPASVADLYKSRWSIEVFFKQIKQTIQLCDFLGHSKNAILWQIWTALLLYVLLRYLAFVSQWPHNFKRIFGPVRSLIWDGLILQVILKYYGDSTRPAEDQSDSRTGIFPRIYG